MNERDIFIGAIQQDDPDRRRQFVHQACASDDALRRRVEELLSVYDRGDGFPESPVARPGATLDQPSPVESPGTVIGPYKLLEQIGEGGMGSVWMAQQTEPVKRLVAVKLIKAGMDSREVVARFEAERQALALMDHPNIARVLDGGTTNTGRPYFVMDLVKGVPITKYCDGRHLTPKERLKLFIPVCQAVQHAHQKGIIHRDLKPSNVLVALYDGKPVPKVIDFGVAKAAGQSLTERTLVTGFGAIVGTLEYMSPEQAEFNQLDIDTRSDVYALGVLLYELLTGSPPFACWEVETGGVLEMLRVIREEEPSKPSTKLSTAQGLPALAANRGVEPATLTRLVRGELDWIVMKALEKDRSRRYETASDLATDLERYLRDEPVLACPPSPGYRLRKFVRRNKRAVVTVAFLVLVLLLAVGAVAGTLGWAMHDRDARTAALEEKAQVAVAEAERLLGEGKYPEALSAARRAEGLLAGGGSQGLRDKVQGLQKDLAMVMRLEEIRLPRVVGRVERPRDDADADAAYADAFRGYGLDIESFEPSQAAAVIRGKPIRLELTAALDAWARKRRGKGADWQRLITVARAADPDEWRNQVRDALGQRNPAALVDLALSPKAATLPLQTLSLLGETIQDPAVGAALLRQAQQRYPDDFWINFQCAWSLERMQPPRVEEAIRFYTVAKALRPGNAPIHVFLGMALHRGGRLDEALWEHRQATHLEPDYAVAHYGLAAVLRDKGQLDEAVAAYEEAIRLQPTFAHPHVHLAEIASKRGRWDEAIRHSSRAIELKGDEAHARRCRGQAYLQTGQWEKAAVDQEWGLSSGPVTDTWTVVACLHLLARDTGSYQELCRRLAQRLETQDGKCPCYIAARVCALSPDSPFASKVVGWAERSATAEKNAWGLHVLGLAHYRVGQFEQAIQRSEESLKLLPDWRGSVLNWLVLALAHQRLGQGEEAARWLDRAARWREELPRARDGRPVCPGAMKPQDWLEFLVLFAEAESLCETPRSLCAG